VILKTVKGIVKASKESDKKARADGELLKYVVEIHDKKGVLNEVREIYSKHYVFPSEVSMNLNLGKEGHNVRGPFPLSEGALANSKLNRWEIEKEKEEKDTSVLEGHFSDAEEKNYKYGYIVYEEIFGIKRFVELKFSDKALLKSNVDRMLNASSHGHKRRVLRVKLSNNQEKLYE